MELRRSTLRLHADVRRSRPDVHGQRGLLFRRLQCGVLRELRSGRQCLHGQRRLLYWEHLFSGDLPALIESGVGGCSQTPTPFSSCPLFPVVKLKAREAEVLFRRSGITFAVYTEGGDPERLIPFDIIPRILDRKAWLLLERGLTQRVKALNAFLHDTYNDSEIVKAGRIPASLIVGRASRSLPQHSQSRLGDRAGLSANVVLPRTETQARVTVSRWSSRQASAWPVQPWQPRAVSLW